MKVREPAHAGDSLDPVRFFTGGCLVTKVEVDAAFGIALQLVVPTRFDMLLFLH